MSYDGTRVCGVRKCEKKLSGRQQKFCSLTCQARGKRERLKQMAVAYKGGKCQVCGYEKCVSALEFHHRDPSQKDFCIAQSKCWDDIKIELDKCDMLCSNCHRELHDKEFV